MLQAEQILQNRYQLKQKLGENAARQTWLATDLEAFESQNQVVVKLLCFGGQMQWENVKLFEREAQVLKQLNHPRIPKYRDYFCIDDRFLWFGLVEDYVPGSSFKDLLAQGKKFTEEQVCQIAVKVLNLLVYLHELNPPLLHRDIKPSNLICGEDEQIYLVDFGAVQDKAAKEGATFTVVGTYGYTPMEQFGGRAVPASDLYALGATLIHLLTGSAPADLPQQDLRIQFSDRTSASPNLVAWIEKLTEPAPERRFRSARQALAALEAESYSYQEYAKNSSLPTLSSPKAKIYRPRNTRVKLKKSPFKLDIKIPPLRGIKKLSDIPTAISLIGLTSLLILILLNESSLLIWLLVLGIPLIFRGMEYFFGNTRVSFDHNKFEIKKQLFSLTYIRHNNVTPLIQDVSLEYANGWKSKPAGVTITSGPYLDRFIRYSFGSTLTEAELIWLAQEIRDWLQVQKLAEPRH